MPTTSTRLAEMRFGRVRSVRGTWGFLRHLGGQDAFAHRSSILEGKLTVGDVVCFIESQGHPHARAELIVPLSSKDPLAALICAMDARRVRPMPPLNLQCW